MNYIPVLMGGLAFIGIIWVLYETYRYMRLRRKLGDILNEMKAHTHKNSDKE